MWREVAKLKHLPLASLKNLFCILELWFFYYSALGCFLYVYVGWYEQHLKERGYWVIIYSFINLYLLEQSTTKISTVSIKTARANLEPRTSGMQRVNLRS